MYNVSMAITFDDVLKNYFLRITAGTLLLVVGTSGAPAGKNILHGGGNKPLLYWLLSFTHNSSLVTHYFSFCHCRHFFVQHYLLT
jgi:hypothetical protein